MAGIAGQIGELLGAGLGTFVKDIGDTVGQFVQTGEEKAEWDLKQRELELEVKKLALDAENLILTDRQSARAMYQKDSGLQKTFAVIFLVGYLAITGVMLWLVIGWLAAKGGAVELPTWGVSLVTAVFTAMSTKVNTIVDFLFGGSQGERDNVNAISRSFESGAVANKTSIAQ